MKRLAGIVSVLLVSSFLHYSLRAAEPSIVEETVKPFEIPVEEVVVNGMKFATEETLNNLRNTYSDTSKPFQETFELYKTFITDFKIGEVSVSEGDNAVVSMDLLGVERSYGFSQPTDTTSLEKRISNPWEKYESLVRDGFVQLFDYSSSKPRDAKKALKDSSKQIPGMTLLQAMNTSLAGNAMDIKQVVLFGEQYNLEGRLDSYLINADKNLWLYTASWLVKPGEELIRFNYCAVMGIVENNRFLPIYGEIGLTIDLKVKEFNIEPYACLPEEKTKTSLASVF
ncbi:hypothetical protein HQ533_00855 [Candidatus Woesearchaeota archaeon]|nr:hypothetical protein [Candidatus Woesearchaeota archaeon]